MTVSVTGLDDVRAQVSRAAERARNLRPFLEGSARELAGMIDRAWAERRSAEGTPWAPSSGDGGSLRTAHAVEVVDDTQIAITVAHPAASYQFFGTEHVPARNPLPVSADGTPVGPFWAEHAERLREHLSGEEGTP